MDRVTRVVVLGMIAGIALFIGFEILSLIEVEPLGIAFNNFFTMVGVILFFIAGFFYLSMKTIHE
jgi:hypothetical protein